MKKTLLFSLCFLAALLSRGSDTLTFRQAFNFSVGDTFDYSYTLISANTGRFYGDSFQRVVITGKTFAPDSASVTYLRTQLYPPTYATDSVTYPDLDSFVTSHVSFPPYYFQTDTVAGRIANTIRGGSLGFSPIVDVTYAEGLGRVNEYTGSYFFGCNNTDHTFGSYYSTLTYYSGASRYGHPYYTLNGQALICYIPFPEDCAFWNYSQRTSNGIDYLQLHTGNKIYLNGHTYVELIQRSVINNIFHGDQQVGYFRNDTLAQRVYFCQQPGANESVMYDFTVTDNGSYNYPFYTGTVLDTFTRSNIQRTTWTTTILEPLGDGCVWEYISGIGTVSGLLHTPACDGFSTCFSPSPSPILKSFCVCGQTLYLDTAIGNCRLLTDLNTIYEDESATSVYPNPVNGILHLTIKYSGQPSARLTLYNILGQASYTSSISGIATAHDISALPSGIYLWQIESEGGIIRSGKLVKE